MIVTRAQWETEKIADHVRAGFAMKAKMGKSLSAKASFGYQFEDGELVPHLDEAPIRKRMYEIFLETKRTRTTAKRLNKAGYRTRAGSEFTYSTVKRLLRDLTAKGVCIARTPGQRKPGE